MRLASLATAAALLVAACGGAAQPAPTATATRSAAPTAAPTAANTVTFTADLKSENEVPPIANEEKSGTGKATVTLDLTRDAAGKITAATAKFDIVLSGFPTTTAIRLAHIHKGIAGANGGVVVGIKTDGDAPIALTTGGTTISKTGVTVKPEDAEAILADPAGYYVNVHSAANGGGVVRGQLTKM